MNDRDDYSNPPGQEYAFADKLGGACVAGTYNPEKMAWMIHDYVQAELVKEREAQERLQQIFAHIHISQDGTDICKVCGLDLRDDIHIRIT